MQEIHVGLFIYTVSAKIIVVVYMINVPTMEEIGLVLLLSAPRARRRQLLFYITNVLTVEKTDIASIVYFQYQEHREDKIVVYMIMVSS